MQVKTTDQSLFCLTLSGCALAVALASCPVRAADSFFDLDLEEVLNLEITSEPLAKLSAKQLSCSVAVA